jgi:glycosyltransferase involved in cell wall biosynthesis
MAREAVVLSYRLGGTDGVSVEAGKWEWALRDLGFATRRVAGEICDPPRTDDVVVPGLALDAPGSATVGNLLEAALDGADLVVVENLCSLPINAHASYAAAEARGRHRGRVAFHHHDLPWQRPELAAVRGLPPDLPGALHVVVNERSRHELAERGITASTIRNTFDFDAPPGDRDATRAALGFADSDLVALQPTRAIPRKNVPGGLHFAETLAGLVPDRRVTYWLTGPAEDGYDRVLAEVMARTSLPLTVGRAAGAADAYAAADVVVFPSTWEGFGNPVVESAVARRLLVAHRYPVLDELVAAGVRVFSVDDAAEVAVWLKAPDRQMLETNREAARRRFSLADLPGRLDAAFSGHGWTSW